MCRSFSLILTTHYSSDDNWSFPIFSKLVHPFPFGTPAMLNDSSCTILQLACNFSHFYSLLPIMGVMIVGSVCGFVSNSIIFVVFGQIHSSMGNCGFLLKHLALADLTSCLGFALCGISVFLGEINQDQRGVTQLSCVLLSSPIIVGMSTGVLFTILIGANHLFTVGNWCFMNSKFWVKVFSGIIWSVSLLFMLMVIYRTDPFPIVPLCTPPFAFPQNTQLWWKIVNTVSLAVLLIYIAVISCEKLNKNQRRNVQSPNKHVIRSLATITGIHVITSFSAHMVVFCLASFKVTWTTTAVGLSYVVILTFCNMNINFVIYYWTLQEFRDSLKDICG